MEGSVSGKIFPQFSPSDSLLLLRLLLLYHEWGIPLDKVRELGVLVEEYSVLDNNSSGKMSILLTQRFFH